jgi:ubiquinone/menaquinone biosynthesis C-methylase UbiE
MMLHALAGRGPFALRHSFSEEYAMTAKYDTIARSYKETVRDMPTRDMLEYAFQRQVGDVAGKSVLDLACGDGTHTRGYRIRGASRVVGLDVSAAMIALAMKDEAAEPRGVEYVVGDARDPGKLGDFDLVTATFFLHYAPSRDALLGMCRRAYENLKPGGRFITLNKNVRQWHGLDGKSYEKYGISWRLLSEPLQEGAQVRFTVKMGENRVEFDTYYLAWDTYEWALRTAGFETIAVHATMPLSEELEAQFGREHWEHLLDHPPFVIIECRK